jgi:hypothetical protein
LVGLDPQGIQQMKNLYIGIPGSTLKAPTTTVMISIQIAVKRMVVNRLSVNGLAV